MNEIDQLVDRMLHTTIQGNGFEQVLSDALRKNQTCAITKMELKVFLRAADEQLKKFNGVKVTF